MAGDTVKGGEPLLRVASLSMQYLTRQGPIKAVDEVNFDLERGQSLGLVGESGCGKSSLAISIMRLLPDNAEITGGQVSLGGEDLLSLSEEEVRLRRWRRLAMVFQAAMNALDPVYRVGEQIFEAMENHGLAQNRQHADTRIHELLQMVGLDPVVVNRYPHELSGGMRQRVGIAMALCCDPLLILADEPTTALDVIVQDRILNQLRNLQQQRDLSLIYITHDIAVVAEVTELTGVMYAGRLVEFGNTADVFREPLHPYTAALMASFPQIHGAKRTLTSLTGEPPSLINPPEGCRFHPRCPYATEQCRGEQPPKYQQGNRWAECWHPLGAVTSSPEGLIV